MFQIILNYNYNPHHLQNKSEINKISQLTHTKYFYLFCKTYVFGPTERTVGNRVKLRKGEVVLLMKENIDSLHTAKISALKMN